MKPTEPKNPNWKEYEQRKRELQTQRLAPDEYAKRIKELADRLEL